MTEKARKPAAPQRRCLAAQAGTADPRSVSCGSQHAASLLCPENLVSMLPASLSDPLRMALGHFTVKMKSELSGVNICFETSQIRARTQCRPPGQCATLSQGSSGSTRPAVATEHRLGVLK